MTNLQTACTHIRGTLRFLEDAPGAGVAAQTFECRHDFGGRSGGLHQARLGRIQLDMSRQNGTHDDFEIDVVLLPDPSDVELLRPGVQWRLEQIPGVPFAIGTITEVVATGPGIGRV